MVRTDRDLARDGRPRRRQDVLTQAAGGVIAGVFYLLVGIFGGFAEGFVDPKLHVAGNAGATAANVVANADLVRMGVVAHLVDGSSSP